MESRLASSYTGLRLAARRRSGVKTCWRLSIYAAKAKAELQFLQDDYHRRLLGEKTAGENAIGWARSEDPEIQSFGVLEPIDGVAAAAELERRMIKYMAQVHMTEAEVTNNFAAVLEKLQQGAEIVVERDAQPVALIKPPPPMRRTLSQCIALAEKRERERGYPITLDPDFAADVEEIIRERKAWKPNSWD